MELLACRETIAQKHPKSTIPNLKNAPTCKTEDTPIPEPAGFRYTPGYDE